MATDFIQAPPTPELFNSPAHATPPRDAPMENLGAEFLADYNPDLGTYFNLLITFYLSTNRPLQRSDIS